MSKVGGWLRDSAGDIARRVIAALIATAILALLAAAWATEKWSDLKPLTWLWDQLQWLGCTLSVQATVPAWVMGAAFVAGVLVTLGIVAILRMQHRKARKPGAYQFEYKSGRVRGLDWEWRWKGHLNPEIQRCVCPKCSTDMSLQERSITGIRGYHATETCRNSDCGFTKTWEGIEKKDLLQSVRDEINANVRKNNF